jgi:peptidoglycan/xylan/chitin deacetylase (PgdA/CDA1 family)
MASFLRIVRRSFNFAFERLTTSTLRASSAVVGKFPSRFFLRPIYLRSPFRCPVFISALFVCALISCSLLLASSVRAQSGCKAHVFLTLDTGGMHQAEVIAAILKRHQVKATFFLANEKTFRGDYALDASWAEYWRARVSEGHQFGSHTFDHVYFRGKVASASKAAHAAGSSTLSTVHMVRPQFGPSAGKSLAWTDGQVCQELDRVNERFGRLTSSKLSALWRAPGGHAPPAVMQAARACGYEHVYWANAGFLGDELPSEKYSNAALLNRALSDIRDGDILMAHLGIWSRKDPFAPTLDPLITGLKSKGFCFSTIAAGPISR